MARPRESRRRESNRFRAAMTAGDDGVADASAKDVCVEGGEGIGRCVERNI